MPYIGKQPLTGAYQLCDTITTSATATYNLLVGGSAVIPGSANNCIVSLNGVIQAPVNAFTVSGSTITFSSTLSSSDVIDFILILGNVFDIGKPTDGSVTNASVSASAAIAYSKLNLGTSIVNADISTTAAIATTKLGAGAVLQVVSTTKTDTFSVSSGSGAYTDITGLSASITPSSASNKILVLYSIDAGTDSDVFIVIQLVRDSTAIQIADSAGSRRRSSIGRYLGGTAMGPGMHTSMGNNFLDSPNTTSSTTYKFQIGANGAAVLLVNRSSSDADASSAFRATSTITLIEIKG